MVSYNATTFHDRDRRLQGVFAAARDMTELNDTSRPCAEERRARGREPHEVGISRQHVARAPDPLNAIIGFSEVLKDGLIGELSEKQRAFTGDIFSSGKHLLALINDILDLSKVEAGKMTLDLERVPVASLFDEEPVDRAREGGRARHPSRA